MKDTPMKFLFALLFVVFVTPAFAQEGVPALPAPIQALVDEGAQIRYLGRTNGLDGWITIKQGQEQYFYVSENGETFLMGLLFTKDGKLETVRQVKRLQEQEGEALEPLASRAEELIQNSETQMSPDNTQFATPSLRLYSDLEDSNWIPLGNTNAPYVYAFMDPQCPHCHDFLKDIKPAMDAGKVHVRMIPVGVLSPDSQAQAAFLLAAPDAETRFFKFMGGEMTAIPVNPDINPRGALRNAAIMQSWNFGGTPIIVYKDGTGTVQLVQGRPKDVNALVESLQ